MRPIKMIITALAIALPWTGFAALTADHKVTSFTINQGLIFELYNTAQQTQGAVTTWPANMNSAVIQATVKNGATDRKLCFQVVVQETGSVCAGNNLVWSPIISTKDVIPANSTRVLTASDFEISAQGNGGGNFCTDFEAQIKKDFEKFDPSSIGKVVDMFLKRNFSVCLVPVDCSHNASSPATPGQGNCSNFTLFQSNPGAQAQVGVLIYPHNNSVPDCAVNFLWTPALYPGLSGNEVRYTLEVLEDTDGEPLARIDVDAGQTYYQWSPRDRALTPGKKYYWRVISKLASTGQPFGGPDGRGWNIQKWFTCGEQQGALNACNYNLADLQRWVKENASPDVDEALKGFVIKAISQGRMNDPAVCMLLTKHPKIRLTSITVTKK